MKKIWCCIFSLVLLQTASGQVVPVTKTLDKVAIVPNATMEVQGNRYASSSVQPSLIARTYTTLGANGVVKLSSTFGSILGFSSIGSATAEVKLNATYKIEVNGIFKTITKNDIVLKLDRNNKEALIVLPDAQQIALTITTADIANAFSNLKLEAVVTTESFENAGPNLANLNLQDALDATVGNLNISWSPVPSADSYELEWTYVSNQSKDPLVQLPPDSIEIGQYLFRNNSSRVAVSGTTFSIPMIYERGYIVYRLRAIGKTIINGLPVASYSQWTVDDSRVTYLDQITSKYLYLGLEQNLNWQSSLSFAEEGKNKAVLGYYDGSARNRQAVTRINTDQRAIVGETFYDYNGRPQVQVLPVPSAANKLNYYPNFNLVGSSLIFKKSDLESNSGVQKCFVLAPELNTTTGASNYYSPQNTFVNNEANVGNNVLNRALIPDAKRYPYTQTQYTSDNTGRIAAQSGVGETHRLNTGKETKYSYGAPLKEELNRLFGNQVGNASHYKKNVVTDPNQQASTSYLDLDGKVIATALAGNSASTVKELDGGKGRNINSEALSPINNTISPELNTKEYNGKFNVTQSGTVYDIKYEGKVGSYLVQCATSTQNNSINLKMDGVVKSQLFLIDDCGEVKWTSNLASPGGNDGTEKALVPTLGGGKINMPLNAGSYQISKKLSIDENKLDAFWDAYRNENGKCILLQKDFLEEEMAKVNTAGCGITCETCYDIVKKKNPNLTISDLSALQKLACADLCDDEPLGCRASLEGMKIDLSPGGQYGQLRKEKLTLPGLPAPELDDNGQVKQISADIKVEKQDGTGMAKSNPDEDKIDVKPFPLSIFNDDNSHKAWKPGVIAYKPSWRTPLLIVPAPINGAQIPCKNNECMYQNSVSLVGATYQETDYTDRNGEVAYATVYWENFDTPNQSAVTSPTLTVNGLEEFKKYPVNASLGLYQVPVKYLSRLEDFEKRWQSHWGNFLIPYHPEYQYLVECSKHVEENVFDYEFFLSGLPDAQRKGWIGNDGKPDLSKKDPYYLNNPAFAEKVNNYKSVAINGVNAPRSMAQMATITTGCPDGKITNNLCGASINCADGNIDNELEWAAFQGFYSAEKYRRRKAKSIYTAVKGEYFNGCIGNASIGTDPEAAYFRQPVPFVEQIVARQCNPRRWDLFQWFPEKCFNYIAFHQAQAFPHLSPTQVCYAEKWNLFKDKSPHFYPPSPKISGGVSSSPNCFELVQDANDATNFIKIHIDCAEDNGNAKIENSIEAAQQFKYETCGLCPMAADLEQLLKDVATNKLLQSTTSRIITCYSNPDLDGKSILLGDVLRRKLKQDDKSQGNLYYAASNSASSKTVSGNINRTVGLTDIAATYSLYIPGGVNYAVADIAKLCCMVVTDNVDLPIGISKEAGKTFSIMADFKNLNNLNKREKKMIFGTFTHNLMDCNIPPRCRITNNANRIAFFLNALTASSRVDNLTKVKQLVTSGSMDLKDEVYMNTQTNLLETKLLFYHFPVLSILKLDNPQSKEYTNDVNSLAAKWGGVTVDITGKLTGSLTYTYKGGSKILQLGISGLLSSDYGILEEFINLRPAKYTDIALTCATKDCALNSFKADAVLVTFDGNKKEVSRTYKEVEISLPNSEVALIPVVCIPVVPATAPAYTAISK